MVCTTLSLLLNVKQPFRGGLLGKTSVGGGEASRSVGPQARLRPHLHTANEGPVRIQHKCQVPIYVFPEMKLCGCVISITELSCSVSQFPHFMYLWAIYIFPGSVCLFCCSQIGRLNLRIYKSLTHKCGNCERGRAVSFLGIHKLDFR